MIAELLKAYVQSDYWRRAFEHERLATVGGSAIGKCARQTVFEKLEYQPDAGWEPDMGAALRGTVIEDSFFVPALSSMLRSPAELIWAGPLQRTLSDGFLSVTPDGLVVGLARDALMATHGIADIGSDCCLYTECKSIDPRANLRKARPEHEFQVQVGMGMVRACTEHQPDYAVIVYIDASFFGKVSEFVVPYSEAVYQAAHQRAKQIFLAESPLDLSPEGKMSGGQECQYCAYQAQCGEADILRMPDGGVPLSDEAQKELKGLRDLERQTAGRIEDMQSSRALTQEAIKQLLRANNARGYRGTDWSVQWSTVSPRITYDTKAAEAAGVNLEPFKREGKASERLTVT